MHDVEGFETAACPGGTTRRAALAGLAAAALCPAFRAEAAEDALLTLELRNGGRLGAYALDTGSGRGLGHRPDERFVLCSSFKILAAAAALARVDAGALRLDRRIPYGPAAVIGYAPDVKAHLAEGGMTLDALLAAAVSHSDSAAANLVLAEIGGPPAVTRCLRSIGDDTTRLDRTEPEVNHPDGLLDTTTPRAFASTMRALLLGGTLAQGSRALLNDWMEAGTTGDARIRAGVPKGWTVGDKTGTALAEANDAAILRPPGRPPILVAAFYDAPGLADAARGRVDRGGSRGLESVRLTLKQRFNVSRWTASHVSSWRMSATA